MTDESTYDDSSGVTATLDSPEQSLAEYWPESANHALETGRFQLAADLCSTNLNGGKSDPLSGYLIKGKALLALGKLEQAAEEFHLALGRDPSSPMALKFLGDIRFAYGAEAVAFSYYERAFKSPSLSGGLFSELSGAPERALRLRLAGEVSRSPMTESASDSELDLPEIEVTCEDSPVIASPVEDTDTATADRGEVVELDKIETKSPEKYSLTLRKPPETPIPTKVAEAPEVSSQKDLPRFDRLALAPEYQTEIMADLLMRQGHARAAQGVLKILVGRGTTPQLIEKLKEAESLALKKGQ